MPFARETYHQLVDWKQQVKRKPLIIQGARQVGKTTLLQYFAEQEFKNHLYINFEKQESVKQYFENDLEPTQIIKNLQLHFEQSISNETLLVFDEIQECEGAKNSLKYFNEEMPEQPIACAGSLLGVKLSGFPVGQTTFLHLYPLSFLEFLNAIKKEELYEYIKNITAHESIATPIHERLIKLLKIYLTVGGMPEIIETYIESGEDWELTRNTQLDILNAYHLDFVKHATPADVMKITSTWNSIPKQLSQNNKKFKFANIQKNARSREYNNALEWLINAGLILPSYHLSNNFKLPLLGYADRNIFKVYSLDTGLLGAQSNLSPKILLEGDKLFTEFKGALTENFAAQAITSSFDRHLFYWTQNNNAEVDFILQHNNKAIPLEVKAGVNTKSESLKKYQDLLKPSISIKASLRNLKKNENILNIPLYLIGNIKQLIDSLQS